MDNSSDQLHCMGKNEAYPILLRENVSNNSYDNKNNDYSSDQLILWEPEQANECDTVLGSINFDEVRENKSSEANRLNFGQCSCTIIMDKIKELLKPTSDEFDGINPSKETSHEDIFCNIPIDLKSDDYGEDLDYYELDGEYLNTYVQELKFNDPNNDANACSEENELMIDEPVELEELEEKRKVETKTDNNKIQDPKSNYINDDTVENINKNKTAGVTNDVQVKPKQKSTKRRVDRNRKKVKMFYKPALCSSKCATNNNEVQEKECNIKYLYTYGDDYRGGIKCGHEKCVDTFKGVPWNKGWITDAHLAEVSFYFYFFFCKTLKNVFMKVEFNKLSLLYNII